MTYEIEQARWLRLNGLNVGSYLEVKRAVPNSYKSWPLGWSIYMDAAVGRIFRIERIDTTGIVLANFSLSEFRFPFYAFIDEENKQLTGTEKVFERFIKIETNV